MHIKTFLHSAYHPQKAPAVSTTEECVKRFPDVIFYIYIHVFHMHQPIVLPDVIRALALSCQKLLDC